MGIGTTLKNGVRFVFKSVISVTVGAWVLVGNQGLADIAQMAGYTIKNRNNLDKVGSETLNILENIGKAFVELAIEVPKIAGSIESTELAKKSLTEEITSLKKTLFKRDGNIIQNTKQVKEDINYLINTVRKKIEGNTIRDRFNELLDEKLKDNSTYTKMYKPGADLYQRANDAGIIRTVVATGSIGAASSVFDMLIPQASDGPSPKAAR